MEGSQLNESLNISQGSIFASTPFKVPSARKRLGGKKKERVFVRPVCDTCEVCGKEYRCHRSYLNHMRQHSIKDAASRFPSVSKIVEYCSCNVFKFVQYLQGKPAAGKIGDKYKALLLYIVSNRDSIIVLPEWNECFMIIHQAIVQDIGEHKMLMPSVLLNTLLKNNENLLCDIEQRKNMCELLKVCVVFDESVVHCDNLLHCFVSDYTFLVVTEIFKYYCESVKGDMQQTVEKPVDLCLEVLEVVHYTGGYVVRGFYNKSKQFSSNIGWSKIGTLIVEKLLESDSVPGPPEIVKGWTKAKDKGKLFYVSGVLFDYFVGVAEILERTCRNKIRIDAIKVIECVCNGCVVLLWDEAVGDSLSEKASYDLMCGMVRSFCTTYAVGQSKNILNNIRKCKGEASLPLRAKVAPKS